jgi:hypothetical protein
LEALSDTFRLWGYVTILLSEHPWAKSVLLGIMGVVDDFTEGVSKPGGLGLGLGGFSRYLKGYLLLYKGERFAL